MQANKCCWLKGAEYCAFELYGEKIVGQKFVIIADIDKHNVYAKIYDRYKYHTIKFSKRTGKQYKPECFKWYWLTKRKVIRKKNKWANI